MKNITLFIITVFTSFLSFAQEFEVSTFYNPSAFVDISSTGTALNLNDDDEINITTSFPISLGFDESSQLRIGNNGAILFGATTGQVMGSGTHDLTTSLPMIAPFWADLDDESGNVYWYDNGSLVIIQWDRPHYNNSSSNGVFQVKFFNSGEIYFIYQDVDFGNSSFNEGADATIGLVTSHEITQFAKNTTSVHTNFVVKFEPASVTNIPDDNFEAYLETHNADGNVVALGATNSMGNGVLDDNMVYTSRIENVTNLYVNNLNITDFTGIADFTALTGFNCSFNALTTLDVSENTALTIFLCGSNALTTLDVSTNTALTYLNCYQNALTTLDVSENTALTYLNCSSNALTTLDISENTGLTYLSCYQNDLTTLDVSENTILEDLFCHSNALTSLDLTTNTTLEKLYCSRNALTALDISTNTALTNLSCSSNAITTLDLATNVLEELFCHSTEISTLNLDSNTLLEKVKVYNNPNLTTIHIQNGANNLLAGTYSIGGTDYARFSANNSPNLTCVFVDNVLNAINGDADYQNWEIDANGHYVEDTAACDLFRFTNVPDDNFEIYLETHNATGDVVALGAADSMGNGVLDDNLVYTSRIENVSFLDVNGEGLPNEEKISDLTGIEDFTVLNQLKCIGNLLTSIDVSHNLNLGLLWMQENQISEINLENNTILGSFMCYSNNLSTIDIHNNPIYILRCENNNLTSIDLSQNTILGYLTCDNNNIESLDLNVNTLLNWFSCSNNNLSSLSIQNGNNQNTNQFVTTGNPNLHCIYVDDIAWSTTNWTTIDATSNFVTNDIECNATYPAPSNNDCANATDLTAGSNFDSQSVIGTNIGTTYTDGINASCGALDQPEVWFTVTVPNSGSITIETQEVVGSELVDSVMAVYSGTCGSLTEIACNDDNGLFSTIELTDQTPGEILYITVYSYEDDPFGEFKISAYDSSIASISNNTITGLDIYPNPVENTLFIKSTNTVDTIQIYNLLGQVVLTKESILSNVELDLSELSSGNYIVKIKSNNQIGTYKLIKN